MLGKWKQCFDKGCSSGELLTDLSKPFDRLPRDLLIAKLILVLKLIYCYLSMRSHSMLGPLLFNVYLSDLFMFIGDCSIANYAEDITPYTLGKDLNSVISKLEDDSLRVFDWL